MKINFIIFICFFVLSSCNHKTLKFQKGSILDVTMDPNKTASPSKRLHSEPSGSYEKGAADAGASYGSSCPTCG